MCLESLIETLYDIFANKNLETRIKEVLIFQMPVKINIGKCAFPKVDVYVRYDCD